MMPDTRSHRFGDSYYIQTADGRKLHYMEKGAGKLTVVFESGMGSSRCAWGLVQADQSFARLPQWIPRVYADLFWLIRRTSIADCISRNRP